MSTIFIHETAFFLTEVREDLRVKIMDQGCFQQYKSMLLRVRIQAVLVFKFKQMSAHINDTFKTVQIRCCFSTSDEISISDYSSVSKAYKCPNIISV